MIPKNWSLNVSFVQELISLNQSDSPAAEDGSGHGAYQCRRPNGIFHAFGAAESRRQQKRQTFLEVPVASS